MNSLKPFLILSVLTLLVVVSCKKSENAPTAPAPSAPAATDTPTPCGWPSDTCTFTPTETATDTLTSTSTDTPTDTVTDSPTDTSSVTDTPTDSPTSTPTETPTETDTVTPTGSATPTRTEIPYCGSPVSVGYESGMSDVAHGPGTICMSLHHLPSTGVVMSIMCYIGSMDTSCRVALYEHGDPVQLIAQSNVYSSHYGGWQLVDIPDQTLDPGDYWIAVQVFGAGGILNGCNGSGTTRCIAHAWGEFPATLTGADQTETILAKAMYCPP